MPEYTFETFRPRLLSSSEMAELAQMVREPFMWYAPKSTDQDIYDRLRGNGDSYVDVVFEDGQPCGFAVHYPEACAGYIVCYRAGVSIAPSARGHGLYKKLIERSLRADHFFDYVATRTQNQVVYKTLRQLAIGEIIYPHPSGQAIPPHILEIAEGTSESGVVEPDTLIIRDAHDFVREDRSFMVLTGDGPVDTEIRNFFSESLGPHDGFMVVAAV